MAAHKYYTYVQPPMFSRKRLREITNPFPEGIINFLYNKTYQEVRLKASSLYGRMDATDRRRLAGN